jgi:hypothetical protein
MSQDATISPGLPAGLRPFLPTDPHLSDLVELRTIAAGDENQAYTWPLLMTRLNEMIRFRQGELDWQKQRDEAWATAAASVGAPTVEE